ncbi:MAG: hypothetical protein Fur002_02160 [Anaerolineales bacterium]
MNPQDSTPTPPVRILVVDDHPSTAATLARALTQLGPNVQVSSATSGHEALEKAKASGVDVLFTDMIMPEMTGLELIEKMLNHPATKPAFTYLVTAYDVPGLKVTAHRLKVNEVIIKPVRPEKICQIAARCIEEMKHLTRPGKNAAAQKKFKILVADDRPDNLTLLTRYLEYENYACVTARDGLEALDKVHDERPDLVLLDVDMPHKDGFTVLEEIRSDPSVSFIPVIILTAARLDSSDVQSGLNLGADDYVTKPFDRHELMARIRTKLRVKQAEDVIRRRNKELNLLPEIGRELSARTDLGDLAHIVLKRTVETLGALQGEMLIFGENAEVTNHYQAAASSEEEARLTIPAGVIANIAEGRQGAAVADIHSDPLWKSESQNDKFHSAVVAPLLGRKALLGVIALAHEQENYFTTEHLLLLQAIGSQAAIAIENARLYAVAAQEQKRLSAVLENAAESILVFDAQGRLNLLNPEAQKLFPELAANLNRPLEGHDDLARLMEEARRARRSTSADFNWTDKRSFNALITPIEDGGQVLVLHDVTRFKDLEQLKNEFIAAASHDLKNPITSIGGFSLLLEQAGPLNAQQLEFVSRIQSAAQSMTELVQNMMSLAQMDLNSEVKLETVNVVKILEEVAAEFTPQAKIKKQRVEYAPLGGAAELNGDPLQIRQALRNLLGNAVKYTPEGGAVTLTARKQDGALLIEVADNGQGIPAEDLPFIFNRFYRAHNGQGEEGNGLGLAIVKSIVERHGGQVSVESEVGKGARFIVSLPLR